MNHWRTRFHHTYPDHLSRFHTAEWLQLHLWQWRRHVVWLLLLRKREINVKNKLKHEDECYVRSRDVPESEYVIQENTDSVMETDINSTRCCSLLFGQEGGHQIQSYHCGWSQDKNALCCKHSLLPPPQLDFFQTSATYTSKWSFEPVVVSRMCWFPYCEKPTWILKNTVHHSSLSLAHQVERIPLRPCPYCNAACSIPTLGPLLSHRICNLS